MGGSGRVAWSSSTWRQEIPPVVSSERAALLDAVADQVLATGDHRLRVAIDGRTAAGKTTLGHELALRIAAHGRVVLRASLDDFKRPWSESHLYDRVSGDGYYRNAFDVAAIRRLLLDPAAPQGTGRVALASIDPLTQVNLSGEVFDMPADGVLVVDGVFAFRPQLSDSWDVRIWIDVSAELALERGVARDAELEGGRSQAERLHLDRYQAAEEIYIDEVDPRSLAQIVIDNTVVQAPRLLRGIAR